MLGSLVDKSRWRWTLWGKHPAVGDFVDYGLTTKIEKALAAWIEDGYHRFTSDSGNPNRVCAWRFWLRGNGNHRIAFGTISSSCDRLGRTFPLLIMGIGRLYEWKCHWTDLPTVFEGIWRRMEAVATSRVDHFEKLRQKIEALKPPDVNWSRESKKDNDGCLPETQRLFANDVELSDVNTHGGLQLVPLGDQPLSAIIKWHNKQKKNHDNPPIASFMGGAVENPYMVIFYRPLAASDFERLWSLNMNSE